jgi:hypothetical protein
LAKKTRNYDLVNSVIDATRDQLEELKARLKEMSAADQSILAALPQTVNEAEPIRLVTIPGSDNDVLWSQMAALGWMQLGEPLEEHPNSKVFIVLHEAREHIQQLILDVRRDELPEIFNRLRREIPPLIGPPVIAAGGAPSDVVMMLAGIIDTTMRRWIREELHEEFLRAVYERARDLNQE